MLRRWKHTSTACGRRTFEEITAKFMDNLSAMGFNLEWREKVLEKALTGYQRILRKAALGEGRRNRTGACTSIKRRFSKLTGNTDWYKVEEKDEYIELETKHWPEIRSSSKKGKGVAEAICFVPHTPGGALRKRFMEEEDRSRMTQKVKYVESMGSTLAQILVNKDPGLSKYAQQP